MQRIKNNLNKLSVGTKLFYALAVLITSVPITLTMIFAMSFSVSDTVDFIYRNPVQSLALFGGVAMVISLYLLYLGTLDRELLKNKRNYVIPATGLVAVFVAGVLLYDRNDLSLSPVVLSVLLTAVLVNRRAGMFLNSVNAALSVITLVMMGTARGSTLTSLNAQTVICYFIAGATIILLNGKVRSRVGMVASGAVVSLISYAVAFILTYAVSSDVDRSMRIALNCTFGNLISIVLFMFLVPVFESAFKVCTDFKLNEYCSFNSPLLVRLASEAPGTFSHSLVVSTLAESCAMAIGENALLARAAAYYHDVGKLKNSVFFVENQKDYNPHDELIPSASVKKIVSHATYGYELLKEYGFPDEICDVAIQHHGTLVAKFFYNKAMLITEGNAKREEYSYAGPKPMSKIAAIVMICDAAEAAVRAIKTESAENVIGSIIKERMDDGQFDDCPITLRELDIIGETISRVLAGVYHKRISYKENLV